MVTRTFLDKTTTIKLDSNDNFGLNPVCMIGYGVDVYRFLLHFDVDKIKELIRNKTYSDISKLSHRLKMKNCGTIDNNQFRKLSPSQDSKLFKYRATSFDIIAFKVNKDWDEGVGMDWTDDFWCNGKGIISSDGATWQNSKTNVSWNESGIYNQYFLQSEYDKYINKSGDTIIVATQHFDHGNENLDLDITDYVNSLLESSGETNYGLCISFSPYLEEVSRDYTQYAAFFNNKTNTIFEPVIETRYDFTINDNRLDFVNNKDNSLYLYSYINDELTNLDEIPNCTILDKKYIVNNPMKGVYSINVHDIKSKSKLLYDVWSNIKYDGEELDDVELQFEVNSSIQFGIGNTINNPKILNPIITGINDNEKLNFGEKRSIKVYFKIPYSNNEYKIVDKCWYRIYVKDGERECDIIDWDGIHKINDCNMFFIKTDELVPAQYYVDIKAKFGDDIRIYKKQLIFNIVSEVSDEKL